MPISLKAVLAEANLRVNPSVPADLMVGSVSEDSRRCGPGVLFVAIDGTHADGNQFLADAAGRGAPAALVGRRDPNLPLAIPCFQVDNPRRALALVAHKLAGEPSRKMTVVGITGTNGKTTVAYMMEAIFKAAGIEPGVLTTVNMRWKGKIEVASQTTPSPTVIADRMARMERDGVRGVAMEVSSHALDQHRADGIRFAAGALTNFTQDHLDYHHDMGLYKKAKERFFTEVLPSNPDAVAVLNLDDPAGRDFERSTLCKRKLSYSMTHRRADLCVESLRCKTRGGMLIKIAHHGSTIEIDTPLTGIFNAVNCLTAAALSLAVGIDPDAIRRGLAVMKGAPGRFERVEAGQPFPIIVDYAHTPDSLEQLLLNARGLARKRLIAVFGCGGDRDPLKRPLMGMAAARLAHQVIITNDNPRTEAPETIAKAVADGVKAAATHDLKWEILLDRRAAIRRAIAMAEKGDVVVIAGKGHEDYQIVGAKKTHFDDRETAREAVLKP
ncbi:UDP-N-acetylmuramoyl-L-alanyl-D-glutamate--2,6-diaminopimelate ligase [bacterium]|nr:UDP-N-acetylmuramoyl-L-alanyl-D-glutamate--2,6-diaminopimelate ligase [bacterium]